MSIKSFVQALSEAAKARLRLAEENRRKGIPDALNEALDKHFTKDVELLKKKKEA